MTSVRPWLPLILLAAAGILSSNSQIAPLHAPPPSSYCAKGVLFSDKTGESGLSCFRHIAGSERKPYLPETIGSGVALIDFDNDGWLDIYLLIALFN
jgi:hypothetical protein